MMRRCWRVWGSRFWPGRQVARVDAAAREVVLEDGAAVGFDTLVLALGAEPIRLPLPGASLPGVLAYRTRADVTGMLAAAQAGGHAVVIGGGLLGLEAAAGLALRGMRVTVLHAVDRLMERQLDDEAARRLRAHLATRGVMALLQARTVAITGESCATGVRFDDGCKLAADLVVMAVGIRPRSGLAREAGLAVGRGILVDDAMRTSDDAIFAIGECAEHRGACCGLVAPALAQAEIAARAIGGEAVAYVADADAAALKVAGAPVWSGGEIDGADADEIVLSDPDGEYRRLRLRDDRLVGAILYGDVGDAGLYRGLIAGGRKLGAARAGLAFGAAFFCRRSWRERSEFFQRAAGVSQGFHVRGGGAADRTRLAGGAG